MGAGPKFLLDTNVLSYLEKRTPPPSLLNWIEHLDLDRLLIPLSAVFEIQLGIELIRQEHPERAEDKEGWLLELIGQRALRLVIPDVEAIRLRAQMYAQHELRGFFHNRPGCNKLHTGEDLLIAASAIVEKAAVATYDIADFLLIDQYFSLPGLYHPGEDVWIIEPVTDFAHARWSPL